MKKIDEWRRAGLYWLNDRLYTEEELDALRVAECNRREAVYLESTRSEDDAGWGEYIDFCEPGYN